MSHTTNDMIAVIEIKRSNFISGLHELDVIQLGETSGLLNLYNNLIQNLKRVAEILEEEVGQLSILAGVLAETGGTYDTLSSEIRARRYRMKESDKKGETEVSQLYKQILNDFSEAESLEAGKKDEVSKDK